MKKPINLICCCCGQYCIGRQWWNRDKGYGLCNNCIEACKRGETEESFESCYGKNGIHYNVKG